ncbi:MAG TPA: carboxypeptidase-like regulatory domain-containing protein [Gemmatimonadaceae bacterium]
MKVSFVRTLVPSLALLIPALAFGQVGSTTDILMGKIAGLDSQAVAGARVEATSLETGITRTKTTGPDGRYTIVFPDGGGYRLTVRAIAMERSRAILLDMETRIRIR